jgi:hypothetical protein
VKEDPPAPKRLDTLRRLDETLNTTGAELRMVTGIVNALSESMGGSPPAGLDTRSAEFAAKLQPILANQVLMQNLFVFRNSDDEDLEDFIAAAQQPAVDWFHHNLQSALLAAALERETHLVEDLKTKAAAPPPK